MKIGILVAMDKEYELIRRKSKTLYDGVTHGCRYMTIQHSPSNVITVMQCGIGKVNAAIGTMLLSSMGVSFIISSGVAGSLRKSITPGMIVVGTDYKYHDVYCGKENEIGQVQGEPVSFGVDKYLLDVSQRKCNPNIRYGQIITGDYFVDTKDVAEELQDKFPLAYAMDMESCAIAHVCHKMKIPFLSYRMISDCILNPSAISYEKFWEEVPNTMAEYTLQFVKKIIDCINIEL